MKNPFPMNSYFVASGSGHNSYITLLLYTLLTRVRNMVITCSFGVLFCDVIGVRNVGEK